MNLTITGHHVDVTSSMRNYVTDKMDRLQRHSENLFGVHVTLTVEKMRQKRKRRLKSLVPSSTQPRQSQICMQLSTF